MERTAAFDATGHYRYRLGRRWSEAGPRAAFVLLNPSTADAASDDPTIRRCVGFARTWGFGRLDVVNLFAWRSAHARALREAADPVGADNDAWVLHTVRQSDFVLVGWGNAGRWFGRDRAVCAYIARQADAPPLYCLGQTSNGRPRHPLYVPARRRPLRFDPRVLQ